MYDEGVLFLVFIQEIGHLQAIDLSLSEQSLTDGEIIAILVKWLNACNDLKNLEFEPSKRIKENIKHVKNYLQISKDKLKEENIELYNSYIK